MGCLCWKKPRGPDSPSPQNQTKPKVEKNSPSLTAKSSPKTGGENGIHHEPVSVSLSAELCAAQSVNLDVNPAPTSSRSVPGPFDGINAGHVNLNFSAGTNANPSTDMTVVLDRSKLKGLALMCSVVRVTISEDYEVACKDGRSASKLCYDVRSATSQYLNIPIVWVGIGALQMGSVLADVVIMPQSGVAAGLASQLIAKVHDRDSDLRRSDSMKRAVKAELITFTDISSLHQDTQECIMDMQKQFVAVAPQQDIVSSEKMQANNLPPATSHYKSALTNDETRPSPSNSESPQDGWKPTQTSPSLMRLTASNAVPKASRGGKNPQEVEVEGMMSSSTSPRIERSLGVGPLEYDGSPSSQNKAPPRGDASSHAVPAPPCVDHAPTAAPRVEVPSQPPLPPPPRADLTGHAPLPFPTVVISAGAADHATGDDASDDSSRQLLNVYMAMTPRTEVRKRMSGSATKQRRSPRFESSLTTPANSFAPIAPQVVLGNGGYGPSYGASPSVHIAEAPLNYRGPSPGPLLPPPSPSGSAGPLLKGIRPLSDSPSQRLSLSTAIDSPSQRRVEAPVIESSMSDWMKPTVSSSPIPTGDPKRGAWIASSAGGARWDTDEKRRPKLGETEQNVTAMRGAAGWRRQLELAAARSRSRDPSPSGRESPMGSSMSAWMDPYNGLALGGNGGSMSDWMTPAGMPTGTPKQQSPRRSSITSNPLAAIGI